MDVISHSILTNCVCVGGGVNPCEQECILSASKDIYLCISDAWSLDRFMDVMLYTEKGFQENQNWQLPAILKGDRKKKNPKDKIFSINC